MGGSSGRPQESSTSLKLCETSRGLSIGYEDRRDIQQSTAETSNDRPKAELYLPASRSLFVIPGPVRCRDGWGRVERRRGRRSGRLLVEKYIFLGRL